VIRSYTGNRFTWLGVADVNAEHDILEIDNRGEVQNKHHGMVYCFTVFTNTARLTVEILEEKQ
jgi:hypothetical protein